MPNTCLTCRYYEDKPEPPYIGECHRYPPQQTVTYTDRAGLHDHWSFVKVEHPDICGEWKAQPPGG